MRWFTFVGSLCAATMHVACQISDFDATTSTFRCTDNRECPDELTCLGGFCSTLSPFSDGVVCGTTNCAPGRICCTDAVAHSCQDVDATCAANRQVCDGPEDCANGTVCCYVAGEPACLPAFVCETFMCSDANDCPSTEPLCCVNAQAGWRTCETVCGPQGR